MPTGPSFRSIRPVYAAPRPFAWPSIAGWYKRHLRWAALGVSVAADRWCIGGVVNPAPNRRVRTIQFLARRLRRFEARFGPFCRQRFGHFGLPTPQTVDIGRRRRGLPAAQQQALRARRQLRHPVERRRTRRVITSPKKTSPASHSICGQASLVRVALTKLWRKVSTASSCSRSSCADGSRTTVPAGPDRVGNAASRSSRRCVRAAVANSGE